MTKEQDAFGMRPTDEVTPRSPPLTPFILKVLQPHTRAPRGTRVTAFLISLGENASAKPEQPSGVPW